MKVFCSKGIGLLMLAVLASLPGKASERMLMPLSGLVHYVYLEGGAIDAFPDEHVASIEQTDSMCTVSTTDGKRYEYTGELDHVSTIAPQEMPELESFKFNNKYNDMLMVDAEGEIQGDSVFLTAGGIGKNLVASFRTTADDDEMYVGAKRQVSKQTCVRFAEPVTYTVSRPGWRMLRVYNDGSSRWLPFGHDYTVSVRFLSDSPTTQYGVPIVRINTLDGKIVTSKDTFKTAHISIDGAGYFPDLPDTLVQIKGRGNSSWQWPPYDSNGRPKHPYRLKFAEKQKPLGMTAGKSWCLIAQAQYGSMTTNPIGQRIAAKVGTAYPCHYIPVELYINGDYRGAYGLTEKIGFANNSIDLENEENAVLLELDTYYDEAYKFHTSYGSIPVNIKQSDLSDTAVHITKHEVMQSFNQLANAAMGGGDITKIADPVYLARYLMVTDLIYNIEFMHPKSTFCYIENIKSDTSRYIFGPIWDLDWGFGYMDGGNYFQASSQYDFWNKCRLEATSFMRQLRYSGEAIDREYYRTWYRWKNELLQDVSDYADDYFAVVRRSFQHDNSKWSSGGENHYQQATSRCKSWLSRRTSYVWNQLTYSLGYGEKDYLDGLQPEDHTGIDLPSAEPANARKVLIDGHIYIEKDGQLYTTTGQRVN